MKIERQFTRVSYLLNIAEGAVRNQLPARDVAYLVGRAYEALADLDEATSSLADQDDKYAKAEPDGERIAGPAPSVFFGDAATYQAVAGVGIINQPPVRQAENNLNERYALGQRQAEDAQKAADLSERERQAQALRTFEARKADPKLDGLYHYQQGQPYQPGF